MTKSNLTLFNQIKTPPRLPEQQIIPEQVLRHPHVRYQQNSENSSSHSRYFSAIERAENYLPLQPFFNNTHFGQTLINCIHNQHRLGIPDKYFVETCINTYTHNSFVTKEFVKIDKDSQTQDYTIIYIRFQGQTPPFSTHNRDIFERLLPTPFPQVGDILSEEEDSESEEELIA